MAFSFGKKGQKGKASKGQKTIGDVKNWYRDRYQVIAIQRNVLFVFTTISLIGLGFAVTAVATLNASKTFEPFVIEVNEKTGIVTQVDSKSLEKYTSDEAVKRYFVAKYVNARESYDVNTYTQNYYNVTRLLSSSATYSTFRGFVDELPTRYGHTARRDVGIKSISFLGPKTAQVRFKVTQYEVPDLDVESEEHYISTMEFDFLSLDLSPQDRYINPLGFQVIGYRRDREDVTK